MACLDKACFSFFPLTFGFPSLAETKMPNASNQISSGLLSLTCWVLTLLPTGACQQGHAGLIAKSPCRYDSTQRKLKKIGFF